MGALRSAGLGSYAGCKMSDDYSHGFFYLQGPDAHALYEAIRPELEKNALMDNAEVRLRYGPLSSSAQEQVFVIKAV